MQLAFKYFEASTDLSEQRELFLDCFPETSGTGAESTEHYRWKFHSLPANPPSYEYAAWASSPQKLLGYYAALPFSYSVGDETFSCGMVCDVMTHSAARGQGVFTKIGRYATDDLQARGIDFTSGYPIRPEVLPGHLKVGWQVVEDLPIYLKVLRSEAILKKTLARWLAPLINAGLSLLGFLTRPRAGTSHGGYSTVTEPASEFLSRKDDAYERFFAKWASCRPVHLVKDRDFLRWRLGAPGAEYHVIAAQGGKDIEALAIVRCTDLKGIPCLAVLDLMALEGEEDSVGPVVRAMEDLASRRSCEAIAVMMKRDGARRMKLARRGFLRTPFVFKLIIKLLSERAKKRALLARSTFDVMWIDSDDL